MANEFPTPEQKRRQQREQAAIAQAMATGRTFSYIDDDECEVTVSPSGHSFYNIDDWY
jgi:hypothetical protein